MTLAFGSAAFAALVAVFVPELQHMTVQDPVLAQAALPLAGDPTDYDPLLASIGEARFVLLGESTHGTHEFYVERSRISQRLIQERGFRAVVIEADWVEAEGLNRYVHGLDSDPGRAFAGFRSFPEWMWRNTGFGDFIEWLRLWNLSQPEDQRVGLYGMDVNDLFDSADSAVRALEELDPGLAGRVRAHYRCFSSYRRNTAAYGRAARRASASCQAHAAAARDEIAALPAAEGIQAREAQFAAIRHAWTVVGSEAYHRAIHAGSYSWNVRDGAMADAAQQVAAHVSMGDGSGGRAIVWAHNTHVGDARATSAADQGETNLGQLLRERNQPVFTVGFLTSGGGVMAADDWDRPGRVRTILPPLAGSDAELMRSAGLDRALLLLRTSAPPAPFIERRLQRAIGVVYVPREERAAHYLEAVLAQQFDAVIYLDTTTAVTPLPAAAR